MKRARLTAAPIADEDLRASETTEGESKKVGKN